MRFRIDCASLIVGSEFYFNTVFALFYFVFESNFPSTSPRGAYIWRGYLTEGFLRYQFGGVIFGGACTRRGLFSEFYSMRTVNLTSRFLSLTRNMTFVMSYLCVANDSDNLAVLLHCVEVILNLSLAILICPSLGSFREGLLLRLAPLCTNQHGHG